jgi:hypothetical protein
MNSMNVVTRDDLQELVQTPTGPCVSMYQPAHRVGADTRTHAAQDPIRFKNLLREAERRLVDSGLRPRDARGLLESPRSLLDDSIFWQYQADGLAVFVAPGVMRTFRVPMRFEELVIVAPRFHLKPLVALLTGDGLFYVLALSQNEVRLFAGTRDTLGEIEIGGPRSLAEALRYDDPERQLQYHTGAPAAGDRRSAMFHGHGVGVDDAKVNILRFFQQVDRAVSARLRGAPVPLVLAGVEYLLPIYREANTHPDLVPDGLPGNPEGLRADEIHARAWPLVKPRFERVHAEARARYAGLKGTGKTSTEPHEIVPAAADGRVDALFVALGTRVWGTFTPDTRSVELSEEAPGATEDLLNLAAMQTILNRGAVYAVPPAEMPDAAALAAVFRF